MLCAPVPSRSALLAALVLVWVMGAGHVGAEEPPEPGAAPQVPAETPESKATDPLVLGVYPVTVEGVIDGDTIRIAGEPSVRILCLDTEETFKRDADRNAAAKDFAAYAVAKRGAKPRPTKYGTPAGESAAVHARTLFKGVTQVRLERDESGAPEFDMYGRRLAHVILLKRSGEVHFAEAMIRAGHSPYFVKYGGSVRFDKRFRAAEKSARAAKLGVWSTSGPGHYPDYPERLRWWHQRHAQTLAWRAVRDRPDHVTLGLPSTEKKFSALVGKQATVRGLFSRALETRDKSRLLIFLADKRRSGFPLVFFDRDVHAALDQAQVQSLYITVTGTISLYKGRPQMVVERAQQLSTK